MKMNKLEAFIAVLIVFCSSVGTLLVGLCLLKLLGGTLMTAAMLFSMHVIVPVLLISVLMTAGVFVIEFVKEKENVHKR